MENNVYWDSTLCSKAAKQGESYITHEYLYRKVSGVPFPERVRIEPTNFCNIRCRICPTNDVPKEKKGFMSMGLYTAILDDLERISPGTSFFLTLYIGGEPLMHRDICKMISMASERGHYTHLNTNCMLLNEDLSRQLIRSGLNRIILSFDDEPPEVVEEIRLGANYARMSENIINFIEIHQKSTPPKPQIIIAALRIPRSKDKENTNRKPRISHSYVSRFKGLPVTILPSWAHHWASDFVADAEDMLGIPPLTSYYPCRMPWGETSIRWDGTVLPCCYDLRGDQPLGKFPDRSLADIWNGDEYIRLREMHFSGRAQEIGLCRGCSLLRETDKLDRIFGDEADNYKVILSK